MSKSIKPGDLADAIAEQLGLYQQEVVEKVNAAGENAAKKLVKLTKADAPEQEGDFKKAITYTAKENPATGCKAFTWGAKAPEHRKTHLLVNGHATVNGGRVPGDPFLEKALETVLPEYETEVEEALK